MASKTQMWIILLFVSIKIVIGHLERIRRQPEVQAYGLPKCLHKLNTNGAIERIHLGTRLKINSEKANSSIDSSSNDTDLLRPVQSRSFILNRRYQISPSSIDSTNGYLEKVSPSSNNSSSILTRQQRSIDDQYDDNHDDDGRQLNDLEEAEAKIFRPLFVYRQQMGARHAIKRSKNPIYGAYQYRPTTKKRNYINQGNTKIAEEYN